MITGSCLVIVVMLLLYIWELVERPVRGTSMAEVHLQVRKDVLHIKVCGAIIVLLIAVIVAANVSSF